MRCVTWSRDSHGLFDYESRFINKKNIKSLQPGKIVRVDNDVEFVADESTLATPNAKPLLTLCRMNEKYYIKNDTLESLGESAE